ncbi:MAG: hypothetical protein RL740_700 [Actinomycetota bacterium]
MKRVKNRLYLSASILLLFQGLLVLTGGLVRLTGSGLGCPAWPKCTPESFRPIEVHSRFHAFIEFGNRMLTFALLATAITTFYLVRKEFRKGRVIRNDIYSLAILQVVGILGQGVLGGITVLTKLHPLSVASHLLLSMLLIAGAATLQFKIKNFALGVSESRVEPDHLPSRLLAVIAFATLIAGTIVTGTGPHAGDIDAPRFGFSLYLVTRIHTALVALTVATTLYLLWRAPRLEIKWLLAVIFGQGFIGYLQWHLGLPEALVGLHLLGSVLFWFAVWRVRISFKYQLTQMNTHLITN